MIRSSMPTRAREAGLTLIELLVAVAIGALLMLGLSGVVARTLESSDVSREKAEALRSLRFAMQRMTRSVRDTDLLILPQQDNPSTPWSEALRVQDLAQPPGSTAVLAVAMDTTLDRDGDGEFDADNDGDGRVNEDPPADLNNDGDAGIAGIDDDGDGLVDEGDPTASVRARDDDEDSDTGGLDEDPWDNLDNDGDGRVDEDAGADLNGDGQPGIAGADDDGDSSTDEGNVDDDDEDGSTDDDWVDTVVYFLNGDQLIERSPAFAAVDGSDNEENVIADNVRMFRVERIPTGGRAELVDIELTVNVQGAEDMSLATRVRVGGGR